MTICTQNREFLFGKIANQEMCLYDAGRMVQVIRNDFPANYPGIEIDAFVIMPNHIHGVLIIHNRRGEPSKIMERYFDAHIYVANSIWKDQ